MVRDTRELPSLRLGQELRLIDEYRAHLVTGHRIADKRIQIRVRRIENRVGADADPG